MTCIMVDAPYQPTDRRPIASRDRRFWQQLANRLARTSFATPNSISIAGMCCAVLGGVALALTAHVEPWGVRSLLIAGALGMQLRLIANLLDGMVAIASGKASPVGELYNEIPDRISDIALFICAGYAVGGHAVLGYIAAVAAVMTAYIRSTGKAAGVANLYGGPMAKQHRMFVMTLICIYLAITPASLQPIWKGHGLMALGLLIVIIGAAVTCIRRLLIIVATLKGTR